MKPYGDELKFELSKRIKLAVSVRLHQVVKQKFTNDYGLKPVSEAWGTEAPGWMIFEFHERVDSDTFLRHLRTMTPEQYQALA